MAVPSKNRVPTIALAWFDKKNFEAIQQMAGETWNFERRFEDWLIRGESFIRKLEDGSHEFQLVDIEAEKFREYCRRRSVPMNSKTVGDYAVEKFSAGLPGFIHLEATESGSPHDITIRNVRVPRVGRPIVSAKGAQNVVATNLKFNDEK